MQPPHLRRKVRAPQSRMPVNSWAPRGDGKCHRKDTADLSVRVKRCGKSAPQIGQPVWQGKPHSEQDQVGVLMRLALNLGRLLEALGDQGPR